MAIEDNKNYTLKGSQVKDLAERVKESASDISSLESAVAGKQNALTAAQLTAVNSGIDAAKVAQIATNANNIDSIEEKIPTEASASNKLADKAFVDDSIAIDSISVNGVAQTPDANKNVDLTITFPTIVQTVGASTTDIMSQNAATKMVFADAVNQARVKIGSGASSAQDNSIAIGVDATAGDAYTTAIGYKATSTDDRNIAIGRRAYADGFTGAIAIGSASDSSYARSSGGASIAIGSPATASGDAAVAIGIRANASAAGSVAIGASSVAATQGVVSIGDIPGSAYQNDYGYNSSAYRLLTGLYDPQSSHDAATKGYVDGLIASLEARIAALEGN